MVYIVVVSRLLRNFLAGQQEADNAILTTLQVGISIGILV